jgi:hypothetical protein
MTEFDTRQFDSSQRVTELMLEAYKNNFYNYLTEYENALETNKNIYGAFEQYAVGVNSLINRLFGHLNNNYNDFIIQVKNDIRLVRKDLERNRLRKDLAYKVLNDGLRLSVVLNQADVDNLTAKIPDSKEIRI